MNPGPADGTPFVTGGAGFAGRHLVELLRENGSEPVAPPRTELDLLDAAAVREAVREARPSAIFHLAAIASVGRSWKEPAAVLRTNVETTVNVLEAARLEAPEAPVVVAGSGEIYGAPETLPVEESAPLRPQNPYAVSKASCDLLAGQYVDARGLRVIRTRSFNQAGPGQSDEYVVGTFTRQVAEAELEGRSELVLRTGNVDAARDFVDVRDAVRAYVAVSEVEPGPYNICSGRAISVRDLIEVVRECAEVELRHEIDPERVRPHDVPEIRGSPRRLQDATGWEPGIPLERTVRDAIDAWRERLR